MVSAEPLDFLKSGSDEPKHVIVETAFGANSHSGTVENGTAAIDAKPPRLLSNFEALIHLLKTIIGSGIFSLPAAFKNAGLLIGSIGIPVMAGVLAHCMIILVKCASVLKERTGNPSIGFAEVVDTAFRTGPKKLARFSNFFKIMVNVFLCISQMGIGCVYLLFTASNLEQVVSHYSPSVQLDVRVWMVIVAVPVIGLSSIRQLKYLAPVSLASNVFLGVSLIIVFYYVLQDLPPVSSIPAVGPLAEVPLYFGTVLFALIGIQMVLPLEKDMRSPDYLRGWTGVLNLGMALVTIIYIAVGFFGYLKYGEEIEASITLNLPSEDVLAQIVKLVMALSVMSSYPIQMYVPIVIIWSSISSRVRVSLFAEYLFRAGMVVFTLLLAVAIPKLDLFISLVGAFASSFIALVIPPVLELVTFWPEISKWVLAKDIGIILFGLVGFLTGTYASIDAIINAFI